MRNKFISILCIVGMLGVSADAHSCTCPEFSLAQQWKLADSITLVRIVSTRLDTLKDPESGESFEVVVAEYEVTERFKGKLSRTGKIFEPVFGPGTCSVGLLPGVYYAVLLENRLMHEGGWTVSICNVNFSAFNLTGTKVLNLLEMYRKLSDVRK